MSDGRRLALFLLIACFWMPISTATATPGVGSDKYWIFFTDKAASPGKAPERLETDHLTPRAEARRARRGQAVRNDNDAPISPYYRTEVERRGAEIIHESRWLNAVSVRADQETMAQIAALPFVLAVRPVASLEIHRNPVPFPAGPASPVSIDYGASETQLRMVNAHVTLQRGYTGRGVRLGFLDTLYDFSHPAFADMVSEGRLIAVEDFTGMEQANYHGLNVSSVAAGFAPGHVIGPAHGAEILAATTEFAPTETRQEEDFFVAGLEWLERMGADVVNVSLGYTTFDPGEGDYVYADMDGQTAVTTLAVNRAATLGVVVVTSAGNSAGCGSPERCWYYIGSPADSDSVITVGAVRPDSSRASFSSFGPTADGRIKPDVVAQGTFIAGAVPSGYSSGMAGTSFSSPLVAGIVAQMLEANPDLRPLEVREILRRSGHRSESPDNALGWGIPNADYAVASSLGIDVPTGIALSAPYPNPFFHQTTFSFSAPAGGDLVRIELFDMLGRRVGVVFDGMSAPGRNEVPFLGGDLPPGVYVYRISGTNLLESGTMVRVR